MQFSEKWLRTWINPPINIDILCLQIINTGIEVEYIKNFSPNFHSIVVGKIVNCITHSKNNRLKIVKIDIGLEKTLNIVCGANNCRQGIKVAVAKIGAILQNKKVIYKRIIQGQESEGMLCSFSEIGMFNSKNIIEFDKTVEVGISIKNVLLLKDKIIKVSTTPNRPDGLSILGISRNIAIINSLPAPELYFYENLVSIKDKFILKAQDNIQYVSFLGRIIKNININAKTPFWMKKRLFHSNVLSENVIENIINYVLIEIGQPIQVMHADNIYNEIIVRMATNKEKITLKNNKIVHLDESILVLSDNIKILSIPGNIHSNIVDIDNNSKNIFLSTILITQKNIMNISKKFNINKYLEYYRYGVDPNLQKKALEYVTHLIINICGGEVGSISQKIVDKKSLKKKIILRYNHIKKLIGQSLDMQRISNILLSLHYQVELQKESWELIPPSWRFDIRIEEDVISDILRIYGYNNISSKPLTDAIHYNKNKFIKYNISDSLRSILVNRGYHEIITYGFVDPQMHYTFFPEICPLVISNPISQDMSCMRYSLVSGLLKTASYNKNRKINSMRFFEIGLCFKPDIYNRLEVKQDIFLGAIVSGNFISENWYSFKRKIDFYDLKGDLESILDQTCGLNNIIFKKKCMFGFHPEQTAEIYLNNKLIGYIGAIDPRLEKKIDVFPETFLFEISLKDIKYVQAYNFQEISKFPSSRRDISISISRDIPVSDVIETCKKIFVDQRVEINLFDVYSDQELHNFQKSIGISIIFEDLKKTLIDNEINLMMDNCIGVLKKKFQAILRK